MKTLTKSKKYDAVIVGGGTAGVSCAYNLAKRGVKTLIIEKNSYLGGSMTSSLVIPAMKTSENSINNDFFNELFLNLEKENGAITYSDGNKGWFNPEILKIVLDQMLIGVGVDILFETTVKHVRECKHKYALNIVSSDNNNNITKNNILLSHIETKYLIDATGDAKICEKLNCKILNKNKNETQPKSLRFIMSGVDYKKFSSWLLQYDKDRTVTTSCSIASDTYVSTAYTWDTDKHWALEPFFKKAIERKELEPSDCNYFQIFTVAGAPDSIAFNAPRLINNKLSTSNAYIEGRNAILRLSKFCKKYLPGFDSAYISNIANSLGTRHSVRIKGKYIYKIDDLTTGKIFKTPVVISNYPVDIHSNKKDCSILKHTYQEYQLPVESLIVADHTNLFVIGRCISTDFKSQAALRIIPSCFSMGEGLAKYIAE